MNQCGGEILINFWFKIPLQIRYLWGLSAGVGLWSCLMPQVTLSAESHAWATVYFPFVSGRAWRHCWLCYFCLLVFVFQKRNPSTVDATVWLLLLLYFLTLEQGTVCQKMTDALWIILGSLSLEVAKPAVFKESSSWDIFNTIKLYLSFWSVKHSSKRSFF